MDLRAAKILVGDVVLGVTTKAYEIEKSTQLVGFDAVMDSMNLVVYI